MVGHDCETVVRRWTQRRSLAAQRRVTRAVAIRQQPHADGHVSDDRAHELVEGRQLVPEPRGRAWSDKGTVTKLATSCSVAASLARRPMVWACVVLFLIAASVQDAAASGHSLHFFGTGSGDVDRVKIRIDDPATSLPGPPADVGATDFSVEFWIMAAAVDNTAPAVICGANANWVNGNVVLDRDRFGQPRSFGVSIAGGKIVF